MQTTANDLAKRSKNGGGVDKEDAIQSIDAMITRVENLKRKVSEATYRRSWCRYSSSLALGYERECRHAHPSGNEGTPPPPLGSGGYTSPNLSGVSAVVRHEVGQVAY